MAYAGLDMSLLGASVVYSITAALLGFLLILLTAAIAPKILERLTPDINEEREIVRGNRAVAEYFGRIVQAVIFGMSLIIAAAILAGFRI